MKDQNCFLKKTEKLSPHNNNINQILHVDPVDQLKYLGGEDNKEGW
jgi:hypothetical protein